MSKGRLPSNGEPIVTIANAYKSFGHVKAVVDVSLEGYPGEVVVIIGPSGGGKSTLLRCINKLETVDRGRLAVDGFSITETKNINKVRAVIGRFSNSSTCFSISRPWRASP